MSTAKAQEQAGPAARTEAATSEAATRLLAAYDGGPRTMHHVGYELPQLADVGRALEQIRGLLYPGFAGAPLVGATKEQIAAHVHAEAADLGLRLRRQVYRGLHHRCQLLKGSRDRDCAAC